MRYTEYPANMHTHCYLDDGKEEMAAYVKRALSLGFRTLGFSCHTPISNQEDSWRASREGIETYFTEFRRLKELYGNEIELYCGMELDYLDRDGELAGMEYIDRLDFTIASVHGMFHEPTGRYLNVDGPVEEFELLLADNFGSDIETMVDTYFRLQADMIRKYSFDILAHCDLIRKRNTGNRYFDPEAGHYIQSAERVVAAVISCGVRIEINTGGMARGVTSDPYPSEWILQRIAAAGTPVVLSSDAHHPDKLDFFYAGSLELMNRCGVRSAELLQNGHWELLKSADA